MPENPFTHHEILRLIEPFTRSGRRVDLASSDRIARRLRFLPVLHPVGAAPGFAISEILEMEQPWAGHFRLVRRLYLLAKAQEPAGLARPLGSLPEPLPGSLPEALPEALLEASGSDAAQVLAALEKVDPASQFSISAGRIIARSYRIDLDPGALPAGVHSMPLILTQAAACSAEFALTLSAPTFKGERRAEIALCPAASPWIRLPDDLIAVLGRNFGLLQETNEGWKSRLRLARREPARSRSAEEGFIALVEHLTRTLAEAPERFHERLAPVRRYVFLRRSVPLLVCAALIAAAASSARLHIADDSALRMLILNAPTWLLVAVFCLPELPRIEIPPWPRRLGAARWHVDPAGSATRAPLVLPASSHPG